MKRLLNPLLLPIAAVAMVLLVSTCVLWVTSLRHTVHAQFVAMDRTFEMESGSENGLLLRVTHLTQSISARVTGMTATASGWAVSATQPVTMRVADLPADADVSPSNNSVQTPANPLAISRMRLQFHGFVWSSGFTADHPVLPGPFPARQVDTFTLSYVTAVVVLALVILLAGYFGIQHRNMVAANRCPKCGRDLSNTASGQCPDCGVGSQSSAISTPGKGT